MSLSSVCIRRPVFTAMLAALPIVLGLLALRRMGTDMFPDVELPIVTVTTTRPGASVEEMETGVTKPIEEEINTISGIEELRSTTREAFSLVVVVFQLSKNRDVGQQEVQGKINTILSRLPTGTNTPIVDKFEVGAMPVLTLAVSGDRSLRDLTRIADKEIRERLTGLDGVGSVTIVGGRRRAVQVTLDATKLEAHHLPIERVRQALRAQNLELPGGRVARDRSELSLRTTGRVVASRDFADLVVEDVGGLPLRLRDLGGEDVVEDGVEEPRSLARLDGRNAVSVVVLKQSGANTVDVIGRVKERLREVRADLVRAGRADVRVEEIRDQSRFITASIHEVQVHLVLGAGLVVLTILLFLRNWRATLIAAVAIPVSVVGTFPVMAAFHLTFDTITLIALVLVIGIVIDDAVIVIENVFRWMDEKGASAEEAAARGTREITLTVVATTLSLAVIFLPIAFLEGQVGLFLRSFGITCAAAILVSLFVSLTLSPMLCSRFLRPARRPKEGGGASLHHLAFERPYLAVLRWSLRRRFAVVGLAVATVLSVFPVPAAGWPGLVGMVAFDFVPKDDQSEIEIAVRAPEGWSLARTSDEFASVERRLASWPEVTHVLAQVGDTTGRVAKGEGTVTEGTIYVRLVDLDRRERPFTQWQVMARVRDLLREHPDLRTSVQVPAPITVAGMANKDLEVMLVGPELGPLNDYAARLVDRLRATPGLADVDTGTSSRKPEVHVQVDRDRAADLGVSVETVAATLRLLVGGEIVADYKDAAAGETYDVWLRARGLDRADPEAVGRLTVPSAAGEPVRIAALASTSEAIGPAQIDRFGLQRSITLTANLAGLATDSAARAFRAAFEDLGAPAAYALVTTGMAKRQAESNAAFGFAFLLSLVLMYMVLAAQFESLLHPITILLAVPLTIPFALLSLILLGATATLFSLLGVFLLFGIVKKNGIMQVDYTNLLRREATADPGLVPEAYRRGDAAARGGRWGRWVAGRPPDQRVRAWAVVEANRVRLRPILMTTVILVAAMVPIALGKGPGAANRADMARVIIGGQALSLLLSLLVTPVAYSLFDDVARWRRLRRERRRAERAAPRPADGSGPA